MKSFFPKFLVILNGSADKRTQGRFLLGLFFFFIIMCGIAIGLYPTRFNFFTNTIDNLGSSEKNPIGSFFFGAGLTILGSLLIPYFIYLLRQLYPTLRLLNTIAIGAGILGSLSLIWFGFVGEHIRPWHDIAADFVFGSFVTSGFFLFLVFVRKKWRRERLPRWRHLLLVYSILLLLIAGAAIVPNIFPVENLDPGFFEWPFWQWITCVNLAIWLFGVFYLVPYQKMG